MGKAITWFYACGGRSDGFELQFATKHLWTNISYGERTGRRNIELPGTIIQTWSAMPTTTFVYESTSQWRVVLETTDVHSSATLAHKKRTLWLEFGHLSFSIKVEGRNECASMSIHLETKPGSRTHSTPSAPFWSGKTPFISPAAPSRFIFGPFPPVFIGGCTGGSLSLSSPPLGG